jgi:hypothetical protein
VKLDLNLDVISSEIAIQQLEIISEQMQILSSLAMRLPSVGRNYGKAFQSCSALKAQNPHIRGNDD